MSLGLSLLSRGVALETLQDGHKKLKVSLEPQDYLNIQPRKKYFQLPKIEKNKKTVQWEGIEEESGPNIPVHKTFTTRKGALLLYAEDMAARVRNQNEKGNSKSLDSDNFDLKTMEDFRRSILSYGNEEGDDGLHLGFRPRKTVVNFQRQIRPGFSARRYMAHWTRSWDDSIFNHLRNKGYIWDKNLFQQNPLLPFLYRRINDNLSGQPLPYRLTRHMLASPGFVNSYEFYRIRPGSARGDAQSLGYLPDQDSAIIGLHSGGGGSIAAIKRDGKHQAHPVAYSDLGSDEKKVVLQRLLVQSALHQQQQVLQDKLQASSSSASATGLQDLNLPQAVGSMVDANSVNLLQTGEAGVFNEADVQSLKDAINSSLPLLPGMKRHSLSSSLDSSVPALPPIPSTRELERGNTYLSMPTAEDAGLPDITTVAPTPQSTMEWGRGLTEEDIRQDTAKRSHRKLKAKSKSSKSSSFKKFRIKSSHSKGSGSGMVLKGGSQLMSSTESLSSLSSGALKGASIPKGTLASNQMKSYKSNSIRSGQAGVILGPSGVEVVTPGGSKLPTGSSPDLSDRHQGEVMSEVDSGMSGDKEGMEKKSEVAGSTSKRSSLKKDRESGEDDFDVAKSITQWSYAQEQAAQAAADQTEQTIDSSDLVDQAQLAQGGEVERGSPAPSESLAASGEWPVAPAEPSQHSPMSSSKGPSEGASDQLAAEEAEEVEEEEESEGEPLVEDLLDQLSERLSQSSRPMSARSQVQLLEDSAAAVAKAVLDRPESGRDLAGDAQAAAELWSNKLAELFRLDDKVPQRTRSAEELWVPDEAMESLLLDLEPTVNTGQWPVAAAGKAKRAKGSRSKRYKSAGAAVSLLRSLDKQGEAAEAAAAVVEEERAKSVKSSKSGKSEKGSAKSDGGPQQSIPADRQSQHGEGIEPEVTNIATPPRKSAKSEAGNVEPIQAVEAAQEAPQLAIEDKKPAATKDGGKKKGAAGSKKKGVAKKKGKEKGKKGDQEGRKSAKSNKSEKAEFVVGKPKEEPPTFLPAEAAAEGTPKGSQQKKKPVTKKEKKPPKQKPPKVPSPEKPVEEETIKKLSPPPPPPESEIKPETPKESPDIEEEVENQEEEEEMGGSGGAAGISRREAARRKRDAEAAKRREAVERKRREREEAKKKAQEEAERLLRMKQEFEEEKRKKEEEIRLRRQKAEEEKQRLIEEEEAKRRQQQLREERERKQMEEYRKKMEEMAIRLRQEEERRREEETQRLKEEEERRKAEQEMLANMAEQERVEYQRRKQEEQLERQRREEADRLRREEETRRAQEEAERIAREMLERQRELEMRLQFNKSLHVESKSLDHSHEINRAFVWSYFELLRYLGIPLPDIMKFKDF